jgi:hypothetical protein
MAAAIVPSHPSSASLEYVWCTGNCQKLQQGNPKTCCQPKHSRQFTKPCHFTQIPAQGQMSVIAISQQLPWRNESNMMWPVMILDLWVIPSVGRHPPPSHVCTASAGTSPRVPDRNAVVATACPVPFPTGLSAGHNRTNWGQFRLSPNCSPFISRGRPLKVR